MTLLLLHPLPLDGSIWADSLRTVDDRCVAPTLYGCGDDLEDWASAALDHAGDGPLVVAGCSIGGSCAIEVARLAPDRVAALVLCGTNPGHRPEPDLRDEAIRVLHDDGLRAAWARYWRPLFGPSVSDDVVERAWATTERQGVDAIAAGVRAFHGRTDRSAFLTSWPKPCWIVSGEHDIKPDRSRRLAAQLPDARFRLIDGAGHYVPLEAPDALTAIAAEALRTIG